MRAVAVTKMKPVCDIRRLLVCAGALLLAAGCQRGPSFGSPTGPNSEAPQTANLSGRVTETGASAVLPIAGAVLTIDDGANAGKTATTNANGEYAFNELRRETFAVSVSAGGYVTRGFSVDLGADVTRDFSLSLIAPRAPFGSGQFRIGEQIVAGRYFADPLQNGCYWERQKGTSGTLGDIIANRFVGYDAMQYIVDILPSDVAFKTDAKCGLWSDSPKHGLQSSISAGVWLVGAQVAPGSYRASGGTGCYWERLRHFQFQGQTSVIANSFSAGSKAQSVTIDAKDVGFATDANCGTWTSASSADQRPAAAAPEQSPADIERNRALHEEHIRMRR